MRNTVTAVAASLAVLVAASAQAQEAPQTPPASDAPAAATAPASEDWNAISRSATRVYMVDVSSLKTEGDVSTINLARVPLNPASPTDHSYTLVQMQIRCAAKESRALAEIDHDETGKALDRFETGEEFSTYPAEALDGFIAAVVCDNARAEPPTFPSIAAFIDAGRPGSRR